MVRPQSQFQVHFCFLKEPEPETEYAAFELGMRMGRRFVIHRSTSSLPSDATAVVWIGEDNATVPDVSVGINIDDASRITEWPSSPGSRSRVSGTLLDRALYCLKFQEEREFDLDFLGRPVPKKGSGLTDASSLTPKLELIADEINEMLLLAGAPRSQKSTAWPTDQLTLCMTHDVDGPRLFSLFATLRSAALGFLKRDRFERESALMAGLFQVEGISDPYLNFDNWMQFETIFGGKSTFLVYPGKLGTVQHHAKDPHYDPASATIHTELQKAVDNGWEIGLHYPIKSKVVPDYQEGVARLEDLLKTRILGGRGHYWMHDWQSPYQSWLAMQKAGLEYDLTLSPMQLGYRSGISQPLIPSFRSDPMAPLDFMVAPTPIMDAYTMARETGKKADLLREEIDEILDNSIQRGTAMVVDWHERTFINRGAWSGYLTSLVQLISRAENYGKIKMISAAELSRTWKGFARTMFGGVL